MLDLKNEYQAKEAGEEKGVLSGKHHRPFSIPALALSWLLPLQKKTSWSAPFCGSVFTV